MDVAGPYTSVTFDVYMYAEELTRPITVRLSVFVKDPEPRLRIQPRSVDLDVARGTQELVSINVDNIGGASTGPLNVRVARNSVLSLVSSAVIVDIPSGNSSRVTLMVAPGLSANLGRVGGSIVFSNSRLSSSLSYTVDVISTALGNLTVSVCLLSLTTNTSCLDGTFRCN